MSDESMNLFVEVAKQTPSLSVLCVLVWLFLKQMSESRINFIESLKEVQKENIEDKRQSREIIKENTNMTEQTKLALQILTAAVTALEKETSRKLK